MCVLVIFFVVCRWLRTASSDAIELIFHVVKHKGLNKREIALSGSK